MTDVIIIIIIIIIIMWLVQSWTLPFLRACSMPVDSALGGRRLLAHVIILTILLGIIVLSLWTVCVMA